MTTQSVFSRYELKYLLTKEQKDIVLEAMSPFMQLDEYGRTTIRNIYYDTDNYHLARHSIEAPIYKEKMRVRSYSQASRDSTVFVELKKKHESVVYKRRIALKEHDAMAWINREQNCPENSQIAKEIEYFLDFYKTLHPVAFLSYAREAYYTKQKSDFRVTFDDTILCRQEDLSLQTTTWGTAIIPDDASLLEIKCSGGIPLWMVSALSKGGISKTSFSKYGTAYKTLIFPKIKNNLKETISYV